MPCVANAGQFYITLQISQVNTLALYSGIIYQQMLCEKQYLSILLNYYF